MTSNAKTEGRLSASAASKGMSVLVIGRLAMMVLSFASSAILARILSPADFGIIAAAFIVTSLADALFEGTFGIGLVQKREFNNDYIATTFTMSMIIAVLLWSIIAAISPVVETFFSFPNLAAVLSVTALTIVFKAIGSPSRALIQRQHNFRALTLIPLLSYFIGYCLVAISLAVAGYGVWSLVWGAVATGLIEAAASFSFARVPIRPSLSRVHVSEVIRSSGYFTLAQVLNWAALAGSNVVVGRMLGVVPLGIYSRGWKLLSLATAVTATPISRVLLPAFSRLQDDQPAARSAFISALSIALPIFTAASLACLIHADAIVRLALGDKWSAVTPIIQLLFVSLVPRCACKISESVAYGFGRSGGATLRQGFYACLMIAGSVIGVQFGAEGVAAAGSAAIWAFYAVSVSYASRLLSLSPAMIVLAHFRAVALVAPGATVDFLLCTGISDIGFWPSQLAGGILGSIVLAVTVLIAPPWLAGEAVVSRRRTIIARILKKLNHGSAPDPDPDPAVEKAP